uniref:Uncharacterized protein n=1 Tax=uncultured bacterium contig00001 TaxID=1181493 RepID=A0A806KF62_9BACT|nr:putative glycosyl hydrolase of unknown function (DUF1680) [uncultured bacterium contig00001]
MRQCLFTRLFSLALLAPAVSMSSAFKAVDGSNVALVATPSASRTNDSGPTVEAINKGLTTYDSNHWNSWGGRAPYPATVTYTWPEPYSLKGMRVMWWYDRTEKNHNDNVTLPASCAIQYHDGSDWIEATDLLDGQNRPISSIGLEGDATGYNNTVWNDVVFSKPIVTAQLRLSIMRDGTGRNGVGINCWDVFGEVADPNLRSVSITGSDSVVADRQLEYSAHPVSATLQGIAYSWSLNNANAQIVGSASESKVKVKGVSGGDARLSVTVTHNSGVKTTTAAKAIAIKPTPPTEVVPYLTGTAAGRAPILPTRIVVKGLRFDTPTPATEGAFNFGEEFESSLAPVVWDMSSFSAADYAADKVGTTFEVKGATAPGSRAPGRPAKAVVTVNKPAPAPDYNHSVTSENVIFDDVFWKPKQLVNAGATIDHAIVMLESTAPNRYAVQNLKNAAIRLDAIASGDDNPPAVRYNGFVFQESDLYKTLEGFAYNLAAVWNDPSVSKARKTQLQNKLDEWIKAIEAIQYADGYIGAAFSARTNVSAGGAGNGQHRWRFFERHEMYDIGHFLESAVAYTRYSIGTGQNDYRLYEVGKRVADHIVDWFGPNGKRVEVPGHQEVELALMKLATLVEEYEGAQAGQKYRDTAKVLIDRRGRTTGQYARQSGYSAGSYSQDATPLVDETRAVGHAVRAMYYYTGATDVAVTLPDGHPDKAAYLAGINRIFENASERNTYITGGLGSGETSEGFGNDYGLRNARAYTETCAAIAGANWYQRLNLYYEDAKYADSYERALYNGVLVGVNLSGGLFYYACYLDAGPNNRSEWFACACCPPNVIRTIANMGGYMYSVNRDKIFVNMYGGSTGKINVQGGNVNIRQVTNYPWEGTVKLTVTPDADKDFSLNLRIPGWIKAQKYQQVKITVDGKEIDSTPSDKGYVTIAKNWPVSGTTIEMDMPMEVRFTEADDNVHYTGEGQEDWDQRDKVVVERGPIVYNLETAGVPVSATEGRDARQVVIPRSMKANARFRSDLLRGVVSIEGDAFWGANKEPQRIELTPYYAKNNRGADPSNLGMSGTGDGSTSSRVWANASGRGVLIRGDKNNLAVGQKAKLQAAPKVNFSESDAANNFVWTVLPGPGRNVIQLDGAPQAGQTDSAGPGKIGGMGKTRSASTATYRALRAGTATVQVTMRNSRNETIATDTYVITVGGR